MKRIVLLFTGLFFVSCASDPNVAKTCTQEDIEADIRAGKSFTRKCLNSEILVSRTIKVYRNNFVLDGRGRYTLRWTGETYCDDPSSIQPLIEIRGNNNSIQGWTFLNLQEGVHIREGLRNVVKDIEFPEVCGRGVFVGPRSPTTRIDRTELVNLKFEPSSKIKIHLKKGSTLLKDISFNHCRSPILIENSIGYFRNVKVYGDRSTCETAVEVTDKGRAEIASLSVDGCETAIRLRRKGQVSLDTMDFENVTNGILRQ